MSGNFTVLSPAEEARLRRLEFFFEEIRSLLKTNKLSNASVNRALDTYYDATTDYYSKNGQPRWGAGHGGEG